MVGRVLAAGPVCDKKGADAEVDIISAMLEWYILPASCFAVQLTMNVSARIPHSPGLYYPIFSRTAFKLRAASVGLVYVLRS